MSRINRGSSNPNTGTSIQGSTTETINITYPSITNANANAQPSIFESTTVPTTSPLQCEAIARQQNLVEVGTSFVRSPMQHIYPWVIPLVYKLLKRHPSVVCGITCHSPTGTKAWWKAAKEVIYKLIMCSH